MDNISLLFEAPTLSLQLILDGLLIGAIFALAAYGMALVWGVMNIINISQGEYVILGGYITFYLAQQDIHPLWGIPVAAVVLFGIGWLLYRLVIFRIVDRDLFISILATFGISILLQQLMNVLFGADIQSTDANLGTMLLFDGDVAIGWVKVVAFVMAILVGAVLVWFLKASRLGQAIRATALNARAARIMGINTDAVYATTYGINAALCGAAGALVVMTWVIHPFMGIIYTVRSFMIVIIASVGNLAGITLVGAGLGMSENLAGFILGAEFQTAFVFSLLVVILVWRNLRLRSQRKYLK